MRFHLHHDEPIVTAIIEALMPKDDQAKEVDWPAASAHWLHSPVKHTAVPLWIDVCRAVMGRRCGAKGLRFDWLQQRITSPGLSFTGMAWPACNSADAQAHAPVSAQRVAELARGV